MNTNTNPNLKREHITKYYIGYNDGRRHIVSPNEHFVDRDFMQLYYGMEHLFSTENEAISALEKAYDYNGVPQLQDVYYIYKQDVLYIFKDDVLLSREKNITLQCSFNRQREKISYIF